MVQKKDRLYVALCPSGVVGNEERRLVNMQDLRDRAGLIFDTDTIWGFLIGPKNEKKPNVPGLRCHVRNRPIVGWEYEEVKLSNVRSTSSLLARIVIAKIEDKERLLEIFRSIPIEQNDPEWRCRTWVANALEAIEEDGECVGTSVLDWAVIEPTARNYVALKNEEGRYDDYEELDQPKPTWDMMEEKEIVP